MSKEKSDSTPQFIARKENDRMPVYFDQNRATLKAAIRTHLEQGNVQNCDPNSDEFFTMWGIASDFYNWVMMGDHRPSAEEVVKFCKELAPLMIILRKKMANSEEGSQAYTKKQQENFDKLAKNIQEYRKFAQEKKGTFMDDPFKGLLRD